MFSHCIDLREEGYYRTIRISLQSIMKRNNAAVTLSEADQLTKQKIMLIDILTMRSNPQKILTSFAIHEQIATRGNQPDPRQPNSNLSGSAVRSKLTLTS
jgi:hypothetical protein